MLLIGVVVVGSVEIGTAAAAYVQEMEETKRLLDSNLLGGSRIGQLAVYNRQKQKLAKQKEELVAKEKCVVIYSIPPILQLRSHYVERRLCCWRWQRKSWSAWRRSPSLPANTPPNSRYTTYLTYVRERNEH